MCVCVCFTTTFLFHRLKLAVRYTKKMKGGWKKAGKELLTISWIHQIPIVINWSDCSFGWAGRTSCFSFALLLSSRIGCPLTFDHGWFPFITHTVGLTISICNSIWCIVIITGALSIGGDFVFRLWLFTRCSCWCSLKINKRKRQTKIQKKENQIFRPQSVRAGFFYLKISNYVVKHLGENVLSFSFSVSVSVSGSLSFFCCYCPFSLY